LAIITSIIPRQNFELIGENIGAILKLELENQKTLQNFADPVNVFSERLDAFDKAEEIMINVFFDSFNSFDNTQKSSQGNVSFFIDIYSTGKSSAIGDGGLASASRLHKFLGMCRYILSDSRYRTLGFAPGAIGGVYVDSIQIANIEQLDASYDTMGRISFSVKLREDGILETGELMTSHLTGVKLDITDKGYKYEIIN
jgi:hypothetical protein